MLWARLLRLLLLMFLSAACLSYGKAEYVRCTNTSGNDAALRQRRRTGLVTVLPQGSHRSAAAWVAQYSKVLQIRGESQQLEAAAYLRDKWATSTTNTTLAWLGSASWLRYINGKLKMLEALEHRASMRRLLHGRSVLDIGSGNGFIAAYLMAGLNASVTAVDIPYSYQCKQIMHSPLRVNFYEGETIRTPAKSFHAVLFNSVLHHAAGHAPALLSEADRIAQRYIVLNEDLDVETNDIRVRNQKHDGQGIFRSDASWRQLFVERCPHFALYATGYVGQPHYARRQFAFQHEGRDMGRLYLSVHGDEKRRFLKWYVLQRRPQHTPHNHSSAAD